MRVTLFGTRGSLAAPGPETTRYGGNTPCVEVRADDGAVLVLDAGTGIRHLGAQIPSSIPRIDILLTHLHMDHIQGLGFFRPLYDPRIEVHIWGPSSSTLAPVSPVAFSVTAPFSGLPSRSAACYLSSSSAISIRYRSLSRSVGADLPPGTDRRVPN
jgi:phosphoribosyl 1,2-cyclic phosphodiesterase